MPAASSRLTLLLVAVLCVVSLGGSSALAANTKGAKAPEIAVTDGINGVSATTTLASYAGSPVLVVIWLPICPHCARFMPDVARFHKTYGPKGLKILTITNGRKDYTQTYLSERAWTFPVGFDWNGTTSSRMGVAGLPGIRLIGADGHYRNYTGTLEDAIKAELPTPPR